jgi:hypothetical protein
MELHGSDWLKAGNDDSAREFDKLTPVLDVFPD